MPELQSHLTTAAQRLKQPCCCLLLGANGAGMLALADILTDAGHSIRRMDSSVESIHRAVVSGHTQQVGNQESNSVAPWCVESIPDQFDVCITTAAVPADDAVLRSVKSDGHPVLSLHQCLGVLFADHQQICVAGTHGKSTTSAMLATVLHHTDIQPSYFVGAAMPDFGRSGQFGTGDWSVLESCEFQQSFQSLQPRFAVLTGIERDHFDCFPTQQQEDAAFHDFLASTPADGAVVYSAACRRSQLVTEGVRGVKTTFAVRGDDQSEWEADWLATDVRQQGRQTSFVCHCPEGRELVRLQIPGRHNVQNAIAAMATASHAGISVSSSAAALSEFSGIDRRFQMRGDYGGVTLIDDYAHHPTAIRETLAAVRQSFPGQRILVAFEPHQISRTQALFTDFVGSLGDADEAWLLPVFPARENATHLECCRLSGQLVKEVNRNGTKSFLFANLDQIASRIDHSGRPNDILLTMGAGRTNLIHDQLNRRLQRHSVA